MLLVQELLDDHPMDTFQAYSIVIAGLNFDFNLF